MDLLESMRDEPDQYYFEVRAHLRGQMPRRFKRHLRALKPGDRAPTHPGEEGGAGESGRTRAHGRGNARLQGELRGGTPLPGRFSLSSAAHPSSLGVSPTFWVDLNNNLPTFAQKGELPGGGDPEVEVRKGGTVARAREEPY